MFVDFQALPPASRLWVYQSTRPFTASEEENLSAEARLFCDQWAAHNVPLHASFRIAHHHFLLLAVNDAAVKASGCSIDDSVHVVQALGRKFNIDFFDRTRVAFLENEQVTLVPMLELKSRFASGTLQPDQLTFSPQVTSKGDWEGKGLLPAEKTWVARYIPKTAVA